MRAEDLTRQALDLTPQERARLAIRLLESLDGPADKDQATVERLWNEEIGRRTRAVLSGEADLVDWSAVRDQLMDELTR